MFHYIFIEMLLIIIRVIWHGISLSKLLHPSSYAVLITSLLRKHFHSVINVFLVSLFQSLTQWINSVVLVAILNFSERFEIAFSLVLVIVTDVLVSM